MSIELFTDPIISTPTLEELFSQLQKIRQTFYQPNIIGAEIQTGSGTSTGKMSSEGLFYGGDTLSSAPFSVTPQGIMRATGAVISGNILSESGIIGGFTIDHTTLASNITESIATISLNSNLGQIRAGSTFGNYILIDGDDVFLKSSNYISGVTGSGFFINDQYAEFGDIRARGKFTSAVFETETNSSIAGNLIVAKGADVLDADMDTTDAETLVMAVGGVEVGDLLVIKDGINEEWLEVTNADDAPEYIVTRDKASIYGADTNPTWKKGTAVVNYGQSGDGGILMTASSINAPRMDVFTHAGSPWSTISTKLRIGNLNGFLDYVTDLYGIGIGTTSAYLSYDPTNGLRLKSTGSQLDVGTTGYILGGQTDYATGTGFFLGYTGGAYKLSIGSDTEYIRWDASNILLKGGMYMSSPIALASYATGVLPEAIGNTGFNSPGTVS